MLRWIAARHTAMDPEDVKAILDVALRTLRKVPMTIDGTDAFFEYLREFGCEVKGKKVHFPEAVIEKTMARIAEHKKTESNAPSAPPSRCDLLRLRPGALHRPDP